MKELPSSGDLYMYDTFKEYTRIRIILREAIECEAYN